MSSDGMGRRKKKKKRQRRRKRMRSGRGGGLTFSCAGKVRQSLTDRLT